MNLILGMVNLVLAAINLTLFAQDRRAWWCLLAGITCAVAAIFSFAPEASR